MSSNIKWLIGLLGTAILFILTVFQHGKKKGAEEVRTLTEAKQSEKQRSRLMRVKLNIALIAIAISITACSSNPKHVGLEERTELCKAYIWTKPYPEDTELSARALHENRIIMEAFCKELD